MVGAGVVDAAVLFILASWLQQWLQWDLEGLQEDLTLAHGFKGYQFIVGGKQVRIVLGPGNGIVLLLVIVNKE